jgi:hypothetical protein
MSDIVATVRFGPRPLSRPARAWVGSSVTVYLDFDVDGAPVDVSGVSLAVTKPSGATVSWADGALTETAAGRWQLAVAAATLDQLGDYRFAVACTAPSVETSAGTLRVLALDDTGAGDTGAAETGASAVAAAASAAVAAAAASSAASPARALSAGLNRLPIEWVAQDYAAQLGGASLATDPRRVIQYAWDLAAATGSRCTLGEGVYALDSSQASLAEWPNGPAANGSNRGCLVVPSNLDFKASPLAYFVSNVSLGGARGMVTTDRGNYRQASLTPPSNVRIQGGRWGKLGGAAATATGSVFGLEVDGLQLVETIVDGWTDGRAYNLAGNGHRHVRPRMINPASTLQTGGMRLWYGADFDCDGLEGASGDDCAQPVTAFDPAGFWFGSISNVRFRNAYVRSLAARGAAVSLPAQNGATPVAAGMANEIRGVLYDNCHFISGSDGHPVSVQNQFSSGSVRGVTFSRCVFDHAGSTRVQGIEIAGAWGGVDDILFDACLFASPQRDLVVIEGRVRGVRFRDCRFDEPRSEDGTFRPIRIQGASDIRFAGGFATMMATAPGSPANAMVDLGIAGASATYSGDTYPTTVNRVFFGDGWEPRNIRSNTGAIRTTRAERLEINGAVLKRAAAASSGLVRFLSVVGSANGDIYLANSDLRDSTAEENFVIDDPNFIVRRGPGNLGTKAPVQPITNANNDNAIIGPGVIRAEVSLTSGSYALVLPAPTLADRGNTLTIEVVARSASNTATLSLVNAENLGGSFTTATFDAVGEKLILVASQSRWTLLANVGVTLT